MASYHIRKSNLEKLYERVTKELPTAPIIISKNKLDIAHERIKKAELRVKALVYLTFFLILIISFLLYRSLQ